VNSAPRVLVLGYGNPGRQDDGLGPALAASVEDLGWAGLTALDNYQLNIEDAIEVAAHDIVWFVDAAKQGPAPYEVHKLAPALTIDFSSHLLRPEALLAIARQCYGGTPRAFLLAIRGYEFAFVESLTPQASENLRAALEMLTGRLRASCAVPDS
jgi:hydrogenase maturation protease